MAHKPRRAASARRYHRRDPEVGALPEQAGVDRQEAGSVILMFSKFLKIQLWLFSTVCLFFTDF